MTFVPRTHTYTNCPPPSSVMAGKGKPALLPQRAASHPNSLPPLFPHAIHPTIIHSCNPLVLVGTWLPGRAQRCERGCAGGGLHSQLS